MKASGMPWLTTPDRFGRAITIAALWRTGIASSPTIRSARLIERGAVIGMAFDAIMMVHGWTHHRSKPQDFNLKMEKICEHIDHICQIAGNARHVGIGTDLDGGYGTEQTPMDLDSIADLVTLTKPLARPRLQR